MSIQFQRISARGLLAAALVLCVAILSARAMIVTEADSDPENENRAKEAKPTATAEDGAAKLPGDAWPLFRGGPQAQGVSESKLADKPVLLWKKTFEDEAFEATAAIYDGVVYVGGLDGPLYALALADGKEKWRLETEAGFIASPSLRDGFLYIGDLDGVFYCIDVATGKPKWQFESKAQIDSGANFYKDKVIFGSQDSTLYCLDRKSGDLAWKHQIDDQIRCFPAVVGNRTFIAGCDSTLHVIDLDKGAGVGEIPIEAPTRCTPAIVGDFAYVGTEGESFFCINWRKNEVVWTYRPARAYSFRSSAAATKDIVVVGSRGRMVLGLNPKNGVEAWRYSTRGGIDASPVIAGGRAYVGSTRGNLFALDIKNGKKVWEYAAGGGFEASPAIAGGRLVIGSDDGIVYCFGSR